MNTSLASFQALEAVCSPINFGVRPATVLTKLRHARLISQAYSEVQLLCSYKRHPWLVIVKQPQVTSLAWRQSFTKSVHAFCTSPAVNISLSLSCTQADKGWSPVAGCHRQHSTRQPCICESSCPSRPRTPTQQLPSCHTQGQPAQHDWSKQHLPAHRQQQEALSL